MTGGGDLVTAAPGSNQWSCSVALATPMRISDRIVSYCRWFYFAKNIMGSSASQSLWVWRKSLNPFHRNLADRHTHIRSLRVHNTQTYVQTYTCWAQLVHRQVTRQVLDVILHAALRITITVIVIRKAAWEMFSMFYYAEWRENLASYSFANCFCFFFWHRNRPNVIDRFVLVRVPRIFAQ